MAGLEEIKAESECVGRFAPSPTGLLHRGSLYAAVGSFLHARHQGGRWLLRVEDLDPPREQPGSAQSIIDTLAAFGLDWDGEIVWQSQRHALYAEALQQLSKDGHVFRCACSRRDLAGAGTHREPCIRPYEAGAEYALRLRVGDQIVGMMDALQGPYEQDLAIEVGDVVLQRRDDYYAYQLAVVVDDAQQGVTEVVRGSDLLDSTPRQIFLQHQLRLPTPSYLHLPVLLDTDGQKLSKSRYAPAIEPARACSELRLMLRLLGQGPVSAATPSALLAKAVAEFDPNKLPRVGHFPADAVLEP